MPIYLLARQEGKVKQFPVKEMENRLSRPGLYGGKAIEFPGKMERVERRLANEIIVIMKKRPMVRKAVALGLNPKFQAAVGLTSAAGAGYGLYKKLRKKNA